MEEQAEVVAGVDPAAGDAVAVRVVIEWKPLYDKILVKRFPPETKLGEYVVAAEKYAKKQNVGRVLRVGEGRYVGGFLQPLIIQPGAIVLFSEFAGTELQGEDPDLLVLREDEILAWRQVEETGE